MSGKQGPADVMALQRLKVDLQLPDAKLARLERAELVDSGEGISGTPVTLERVNTAGQPDAAGSVLRLSGGGEVTGNGEAEKTADAPGGLTVDFDGKDTSFTLPKVKLTFTATGKPGEVVVGTVRNDDASAQANVAENFLTMRVSAQIDLGVVIPIPLVVNCAATTDGLRAQLFKTVIVGDDTDVVAPEPSTVTVTQPAPKPTTVTVIAKPEPQPETPAEPVTPDKPTEEPTEEPLPTTVDGTIVKKHSVIASECTTNGAPMGQDSSFDVNVRVDTKAPKQVAPGENFDIIFQPDEMEMDGSRGMASLNRISRMKVDLRLPDPKVATFVGAEVLPTAKNISGASPTVQRIAADGTPDPNGPFLRLTGAGEVEANGPGAARADGGITVNLNGQATKFTLPGVKLTFCAGDKTHSGEYVVAAVRDQGVDGQKNQPSNFLTMRPSATAKILGSSLPVNLGVYCAPKEGFADLKLARVRIIDPQVDIAPEVPDEPQPDVPDTPPTTEPEPDPGLGSLSNIGGREALGGLVSGLTDAGADGSSVSGSSATGPAGEITGSSVKSGGFFSVLSSVLGLAGVVSVIGLVLQNLGIQLPPALMPAVHVHHFHHDA